MGRHAAGPPCACRRAVPYGHRFAVQTENAVSWVEEMTNYNVPHGKLNRGLAVLDGAPPRSAPFPAPCSLR
jgi:hypothetical protein